MVIKKIFDWVDDGKYECYFNEVHVQKDNNDGTFSDFSRLDKAQAWFKGYLELYEKENPKTPYEAYILHPKSKVKKTNMSYLLQIQNGDTPKDQNSDFGLTGEGYVVRTQSETETYTQTYFNKDWLFYKKESNDINSMGNWSAPVGNAGNPDPNVYRHSHTFTTKYWQIKAVEVGNPANEKILDIQTNELMVIDNVDPDSGTLTFTKDYNSATLNLSPTDNVAVTAIDIYINDAFSETVNASQLNNYEILGLTSDTPYTIYTIVKDGENNQDQSNTVSFTTDSAPATSTKPPKLYNFRINAPNNQILCDSTEPLISGSNSTGFFLGDGLEKTVTTFTRNGSSLTNHYFTLNSNSSFWDNFSLRYEGGSNIVGSGSLILHPFTLDFVANNITEPSANTNRYVTTSATGGGNGLSEATAWTLSEAFSNVSAGQTVWVKSGNYGKVQETLYNDGTPTQPIKFIGYKNSTANGGDITTNYYDYNVTWNNSEMPTLTGDGNGDAIYLFNVNYVKFKNIQIRDYNMGFRSGTTGSNHNSNVIFENINGYELGIGDGVTYGTGRLISMATVNSGKFVGNTNIRVLNSVVVNASSVGFNLKGDGNCLLDGNKSYSDKQIRADRMDYHVSINGHNNIVRNHYAESFEKNSNNVSTHGITVRGDINRSSTYNLFEWNTTMNLGEAFAFRNYGSHYNVCKDSYAGNNGNTATNGNGGLVIWGGADHNVFERITIEDTYLGVMFYDNVESDGSEKEIGKNNIVRNCIFIGQTVGIKLRSAETGSTMSNNKFIHTVWDGVGFMFMITNNTIVNTGLEIINSIILNATNPYSTYGGNSSSQINYSYTNFYNSFTTPSGAGNISVDPKLDANYKPTISTPTSVSEGGQTIVDVLFDFDGEKRETPYSIGAYNKYVPLP